MIYPKEPQEKSANEEQLREDEWYKLPDAVHHEADQMYKLKLTINPEKPKIFDKSLENQWISVAFQYGDLIAFDPGQIISVNEGPRKGSKMFEIYYPKMDERPACTQEYALKMSDYRGGLLSEPSKILQWRMAHFGDHKAKYQAHFAQKVSKRGRKK